MMMQPLESVSASVQAFLSAPEQLLQQSVALQLAVADFPDTPRSILEILVNSPEEQVAQAAQLHVNLAGEMTDGWQQAVDERLQTVQLGQNDRLAVELLKLGPVPPCFFSEWVPAERLIQGLRNPYMPILYRLQLLERLAQEPTLEPRLQVAESSDKEKALEITLRQAGMLETAKFIEFSIEDLAWTFERNEIMDLSLRYQKLNQFLKQNISDLRLIRCSFWNRYCIYVIGEIKSGDLAGVYIESDFHYNP